MIDGLLRVEYRDLYISPECGPATDWYQDMGNLAFGRWEGDESQVIQYIFFKSDCLGGDGLVCQPNITGSSTPAKN